MGDHTKTTDKLRENSKQEETLIPCASCKGTGRKTRKYSGTRNGKRKAIIDCARLALSQKPMTGKELNSLIKELCEEDGTPVTPVNARQLCGVVKKHDDIRIVDGLIYWIGDV